MAPLSELPFVLVIGGSGGIGSAICRLLTNVGFRPIIGFNSNREAAHKLANECQGIALKIDLADDTSIKQLIEAVTDEVKQKHSVLAGVVLGASPPPNLTSFIGTNSEALMYQFRVNVVGQQLLLAGLIKNLFRNYKAGFVIGVLTEAMGSALEPPKTGMVSYVVAKAAMKSMLSVCAAEYPWLKIGSVSPGLTETKMLSVFDPRYLELAKTQKPLSSPDEIALLIIDQILS